ncbi:MAG: CDP-diacylglycerol--glycerol-3-phosphate 3-phosphatidyltransferase [Clostridiales bacterium]|nr:CDP-diacylglycerol--glycerol-3-phosphate 3-phosphatidyltransferase [Clostridiales bacterium]
MNTPNKLTLLRMFMSPIFLAVLIANFSHNFLAALIVFALAAITDFIDGHLARKNNQITNFGKLLDPVADKMLTTAAFLAFMQMGLCNIWIIMVILTREFLILSLRLIASSQGIIVPANIWGKIKTVSQMVSIILVLLLCELSNYISTIVIDGFGFKLFTNILFSVTALFTVISGVIYILEVKKKITFTK